MRSHLDLIRFIQGKKLNSKLYVGNVSYNTDEADLRSFFAGAGEIKTITIPKDRMSNQPRGFAFVEMNTADEARKAIQMFNGRELDGRALMVNEAKPPENRSSGFKQNSGNRRY